MDISDGGRRPHTFKIHPRLQHFVLLRDSQEVNVSQQGILVAHRTRGKGEALRLKVARALSNLVLALIQAYDRLGRLPLPPVKPFSRLSQRERRGYGRVILREAHQRDVRGVQLGPTQLRALLLPRPPTAPTQYRSIECGGHCTPRQGSRCSHTTDHALADGGTRTEDCPRP